MGQFQVAGNEMTRVKFKVPLTEVQRTGEEGRAQCRYQDIFVPDDDAELAVGAINHERIPVLLTREEEFDIWLRVLAEGTFALAREYPPEKMQIVQEGLKKEDLLAA